MRKNLREIKYSETTLPLIESMHDVHDSIVALLNGTKLPHGGCHYTVRMYPTLICINTNGDGNWYVFTLTISSIMKNYWRAKWIHVHTRCRVILVAKNYLTTYQNMKNNKLLLNSQMNSESCDSQSSYTAMHMRSSEYITLITIMMINNNNYYHYCYCHYYHYH